MRRKSSAAKIQPDSTSSGLTGHLPPRPDETSLDRARPTLNDAESPLAWLRSRKDKAGRPLLTTEQYLAGEKLRIDYERSMLQRRVTQNWDMASAGRGGGNIAAGLSDGALSARQKFHAALDTVGPELASILVQICCLSAGIEQAERLLDLPQRSGKAVLGLALTGLARHYGLLRGQEKTTPRGRIGQWSLPDYRPKVALPEET